MNLKVNSNKTSDQSEGLLDIQKMWFTPILIYFLYWTYHVILKKSINRHTVYWLETKLIFKLIIWQPNNLTKEGHITVRSHQFRSFWCEQREAPGFSQTDFSSSESGPKDWQWRRSPNRRKGRRCRRPLNAFAPNVAGWDRSTPFWELPTPLSRAPAPAKATGAWTRGPSGRRTWRPRLW